MQQLWLCQAQQTCCIKHNGGRYLQVAAGIWGIRWRVQSLLSITRLTGIGSIKCPSEKEVQNQWPGKQTVLILWLKNHKMNAVCFLLTTYLQSAVPSCMDTPANQSESVNIPAEDSDELSDNLPPLVSTHAQYSESEPAGASYSALSMHLLYLSSEIDEMAISDIQGVHQPCPHWNGIHHKEEADQFMRVTNHGNILRAFCFTLEIKILWGENWKGWQSLGVKPRTPLAWAASALPLSHNSWAITNPHNPLYALHKWTKCLSHTPGNHLVCAIRTPLGVDQKIPSIRQ